MSRSYAIAEDGKSITCNLCNRTSYNMNDVGNTYCGHCHIFHEPGLDEDRCRLLNAAVAVQQLLPGWGYVIIAVSQTEDGIRKIQPAANISPEEVRRVVSQFLAAITPKETPE